MAQRFSDEREALRALPQRRFEARHIGPVAVSRQALVRVDGAQYSVPSHWSGSQATAYVGVTDSVLEWREERITVAKLPRGGRVSSTGTTWMSWPRSRTRFALTLLGHLRQQVHPPPSTTAITAIRPHLANPREAWTPYCIAGNAAPRDLLPCPGGIATSQPSPLSRFGFLLFLIADTAPLEVPPSCHPLTEQRVVVDFPDVLYPCNAAMTWQSRNARWTSPGYQPWWIVGRCIIHEQSNSRRDPDRRRHPGYYRQSRSRRRLGARARLPCRTRAPR